MNSDSSELLQQPWLDPQFFENFFDKTGAIFWVADPVSFQCLYVSQFAEEVLGFSRADWQRPNFWQDSLFSEDRDWVLSVFATALDTQEPQEMEYRLRAADGSLVWFRDKVSLLTFKGKQLLCGLMTDVTLFKTAVGHHIGIPGYTSIYLEIVTLLSGNTDIMNRLRQLVERLCALFDLTAVNVLEWHASWDEVSYLATYAAQENQIRKRPLKLTPLLDGLDWQETAVPVQSDRKNPDLPDWQRNRLQAYEAQTILYVPIQDTDNVSGCIELVERRASRNFTSNDIALCNIVAQQTGNALVRARLFQAEARRRREAEILLDVAEFVSSSLDLDEILTRVMEILRVYLSDIHNCVISLLRENGKLLETVVSWWSDEAFALMPRGTLLKVEDMFTAGLAVEGGEPINISDLRAIPFTNEFTLSKIQKGLRSILCVPLKIQDRTLGTLHIHHWNEIRRFSNDEIALLQGVANQAAIAIENARLFANERRQLHLSQTLQEVGSLLTSTMQLEQVYEHIFELLGQVISYHSASLFLLDRAKDQFAMVMARGLPDPVYDSRDFVLPSQLVFEQIPIAAGWTVVSDLREFLNWANLAGDHMERAWVGALLVVKDEVIGLLSVDGDWVGQYSREDGRTVAAFANQAAVAIENARLLDETMRQAKELAVLNQVSQETAVSLNIDHFLAKVTRLVGNELYPYSFGFIMYNATTNTLQTHPSYQGISEEAKKIQVPVESSIIGEVIRNGLPYYAPDVTEDPNYFPLLTTDRSEIVVPLKVNSEVIGVIDAASPEPEHYDQQDIHFLTTLAGSTAAVLERARLYQTLRIQTETLAEQVEQRTVELQLEKDRLFAILESAGEGIILTDTEAHILYVNPAMERQSGYTREELRLQNPNVFGSGKVPKAVFDDMWHHLLSKKRWTGELINRQKNGKIYDVAVAVTPISGPEGEVTGYVSVQADITRLKEVDRLKTEFIANVSHQLRTPLTNIKTYVSLLEKGRAENFPRYFSVLHYEIDRLARLIQDLLDISRLDAEAVPNPDAAVDFCDHWDMFWLPFMERAEREQKALSIDLPTAVRERSPYVFMERYQLEKIMSRLVENAFMYAPEGSKIEAQVNWQPQTPEALILKVCDNGPGIPEDERPFVFDRFFRGAQAIEDGMPGNGLGLAIVQELLKQRGGEIWLESKVGEGSCFFVQLPLIKPKMNGDAS